MIQTTSWEEFVRRTGLVEDPDEIRRLGLFDLLEDKINPADTSCRFPYDRVTEAIFSRLEKDHPGYHVVTAVEEDKELVILNRLATVNVIYYHNRPAKVNAIYYHVARGSKEDIVYLDD